MNNIINVSSVTYAIKGRDILRRNGIYAYVERGLNDPSRKGCGYHIVVKGDREEVVNILKANNIKLI